MTNQLKTAALEYHRSPKPGKLSIAATKPLGTQRDLALAYSPGVAYACEAIIADPEQAAKLTVRGNLVAVITNGTAVLGLGDIGPLAAKPVMEGKAVLFKKFAGIDVFDLEIAERDPSRLADIVAGLEPTFGAINLEDIKAPECFEVESLLRKRMNIPVFHDDQHGTAIVATAALVNALKVVGKDIGKVKMVSTGGGAAGIACLNLMVDMGLDRENITLVDRIGVVYAGRTEEMDPYKAAFAQDTAGRTLDDVIDGADVFLGLSAPGILTSDMVSRMVERPIILALANPNPEIVPEDARSARPDCIIATGRSDYPNQVNNVLCFPFIFRGALDVGATTFNEEMKLAAATAIAGLAMAESSEIVDKAYGGELQSFGPDYLIPKPFDPRLIGEIAPAIAKAAMDSGVAARPIEDFDAYREQLDQFVFRSGLLMKPIFTRSKEDPKRVVYAEGENRRVLRAVQTLVDEGMVRPILVGRPEVIQTRIHQLGLRIRPDREFEIVNPQQDDRYDDYWRTYQKIMERKGITPAAARTIVHTNTTVIAALMLEKNEADAMICGVQGRYHWHLKHVLEIIAKAEGVKDVSAMIALILPRGTFFFCDTHVTFDPTSEELVEMTLLGADAVKRFGIEPKIALLSHSNFGSSPSVTSVKMREATRLLRQRAPDLEVEGEMHGDTALDEELRQRIFPSTRLSGQANTFIFPNIDAANNAYNLVKSLGEAQPVGPVLLGTAKPTHILTQSVTVRGIINMSAVAVVHAQG